MRNFKDKSVVDILKLGLYTLAPPGGGLQAPYLGGIAYESSHISASFSLSDKHRISTKGLTMQTGQSGIEAGTYSCLEITGSNKTI